MKHLRSKFQVRGFDAQEYQRYVHRHQDEATRLKLRCVEGFALGQQCTSLAQSLGIHPQSCRSYINMYIDKGFVGLCAAIKRPRAGKLSAEQESSFKTVLLTSRPCDHSLEGNIWTGSVMCQYLQKAFSVTYKSGIYDLLERLGLSHQRAHADYGNAVPEDQAAFIRDLAETLHQADDRHAVISFDEFSVGAIPTPYNGWAVKNTRPTVKTNEKKENEQTDCLPLTL
jgi:transposase